MNPLRGATELESYLHSLREGGSYQDSGRFTVSSQEKLRKMADLARSHAIRWVFYAVQSAVESQALGARLSVSQSLASVGWEMHSCPEWLADPQALAQLAEGLSRRRDYEYLRQALLWGLAQQPDHLSLVVEGPGSGLALEYRPEGVSQRELPPEPDRKLWSCHLSFSPSQEDRRFRRHSVALAFHSEASFRLSFCPMSVMFDHKQLSQGRVDALLKGSSHWLPESVFNHLRDYLMRQPARPTWSLRRVLNAHLEEFLKTQRRTPSLQLQSLHLSETACLGSAHPSESRVQHFYLGNQRVLTQPGQAFDVKNYSLTSDQPGLELVSLPVHSPPPESAIELGRYANIRLYLKTRMQCSLWHPQQKNFSRVRCQMVMAHLPVRGNHLMLAQSGMLLDPIEIPTEKGFEGWVWVLDAPQLQLEITGSKAINSPELEVLQQRLRQAAKLWT